MPTAGILHDDGCCHRTRIVGFPCPSGYVCPFDPPSDSSQPDMVNHPPHYTQGGIECIEAIRASMSAEAFKGYLKGNQIKYLWRYEHKGKHQDLQKALWYLNKLLEVELSQ